MSKKEGYSRKGLFGEISIMMQMEERSEKVDLTSWEDTAITIQMVTKQVRADQASLAG